KSLRADRISKGLDRCRNLSRAQGLRRGRCSRSRVIAWPQPPRQTTSRLSGAADSNRHDGMVMWRWGCRSSQVSFPGLFDDVIARAPGQGHDGERRVLVGIRWEGRAIAEEKV